MLIANLPRYDFDRDYNCGQSCGLGLCEYNDGEWVKFEDVVEASSNSLQQLKAEIAALVRDHYISAKSGCNGYVQLVQQLRQLSAV